MEASENMIIDHSKHSAHVYGKNVSLLKKTITTFDNKTKNETKYKHRKYHIK